MVKIVRYNGGTKCSCESTNPVVLVINQEYEVVAISVDMEQGQILYKLRGIEGCFNACWFNEVNSLVPMYMAYAKCIPSIGQKYESSRLGRVNGNMVFFKWLTNTPVEEVRHMGNNFYYVTTQDDEFIVQVI